MKKNKKLLKRIKRDLAYLGARTIICVFRLLPRKTALTVGSALGRIASVIDRKDYTLAVEHLTVAFGKEKDEKEIRRLAHETFRHLAMNFVDVARLYVMSPEEIKSVCVLHNLEILKDNLTKGYGVIGLTSHAGCWELLGQYFALMGIPTSCISQRLYDPRLEKMLIDTRTRVGIKNISRGQDTRDIIRVLKKGYLLAILIDQDTNVKGEFVDFFGQPAYTATSPALLSLRYKAPIIPIFIYRDEYHRHHVCIEGPVEIKATEDNDSDALGLTVQCSKVTEQFISEHPEQWVWFHRRWKTKKNGIVDREL